MTTMAAKLIRPNDGHNAATRLMDKTLSRVQHRYGRGLDVLLRKHWIAGLVFVAVMMMA